MSIKSIPVIAIQGFPGSAGEIHELKNTTIPIPWPDDTADVIGITKLAGRLYVLENSDPGLQRIQVNIKTASTMIGTLRLVAGNEHTHTRQNCLIGYSDLVTGFLPDAQAVQFHVEAKKTDGLSADVVFTGNTENFHAERFNMTVQAWYSYFVITESGRVRNFDPTPIIQITTLWSDPNNQSSPTKVLCLEESGRLRMATINLQTGTTTWTTINLV